MIHSQFDFKSIADSFPENLSVGVLYGGTSHEREISLTTGQVVTQALSDVARVSAIDTARVPQREWLDADYDIYFIALHGHFGEDGQVQTLLQNQSKKYTGSNPSACTKAFSKHWSKLIWQENGLPTAKWSTYRASELADFIRPSNNDLQAEPLFVKPVRQGSSLGCSHSFYNEINLDVPVLPGNQKNSSIPLKQAMENAAAYDSHVMVERQIAGTEYTVGLLDGKALPMVMIEPQNSFYDYDAKYGNSQTEYSTDIPLPAATIEQGQKIAVEAFNLLGCSGWGRVDLFFDQAKRQWILLEVNVVPGLTSRSLVPMGAKQQGLSLTALVQSILVLGLERKPETSNIIPNVNLN